MVEALVPDQLTTASIAEVFVALHEADPSLSRNSLLVLLAQWSFEDGRGKAMHCWNLGNIKYTPGCGHDYFQVACNEVIGGHVVWLQPPNPGTSFRAYETLADGVADFLGVLKRDFKAAWPAVLDGDPAEFARLLKASRYYTADEAVYQRGLVGLFTELGKEVPQEPAPEPPQAA